MGQRSSLRLDCEIEDTFDSVSISSFFIFKTFPCIKHSSSSRSYFSSYLFRDKQTRNFPRIFSISFNDFKTGWPSSFSSRFGVDMPGTRGFLHHSSKTFSTFFRDVFISRLLFHCSCSKHLCWCKSCCIHSISIYRLDSCTFERRPGNFWSVCSIESLHEVACVPDPIRKSKWSVQGSKFSCTCIEVHYLHNYNFSLMIHQCAWQRSGMSRATSMFIFRCLLICST